MGIVWTKRYLLELSRIGDYIATHNPRAAARIVNDIHAKTHRLLSDNPFIGRRGEITGTRDSSYPARLILLRTVSEIHKSKFFSFSMARGNGRKTPEARRDLLRMLTAL